MKSITEPDVLEQLVRRLALLTPATQRRWGTMTPGEMLCHLADASASVLGRPGSGPGPSRMVRKWVALYSPLPWPHGLRTPRSVNPRIDGTKPADFEGDRNRAVAGLRALAAAPPSAFPAAHAIFGAMTAGDWHRWAFRHTDHHLRQFGL